MYARGEDFGVVEMATADEVFLYGREHKRVKTVIADFMNLHRSDVIDKSELDQHILDSWILLTMEFVECLGADKVTYDIRCLINNVHEELGLTAIE